MAQEGAWGVAMARGEVEVLLTCEAGTLTEVILTFTLDRDSPRRLGDWEELVATMHRAFALQLVDRLTLEPVEANELRRLITSAPTWGEFAEHWCWPGPAVFAVAGKSDDGQAPRPSPRTQDWPVQGF